MELDQLRQEIDAIDNQLLELLNQRAKLVQHVGEIKARRPGGSFFVPERELAIFERLSRRNPGPFSDEAIGRIFREIISASLALEQQQKIVYLGPEATFTHAAALKQFGQSARLVPARGIPVVFEEVERGRARYGVVPIENSNEGAVTHTLDRFVSSDVKIVAETYLEISHDLLSHTESLEQIKRVYSHPQAIEQCRHWLDNHLPGAAIQEVSSTARAAQIAAGEEFSAAIAGRPAALLYGLRVVAPRIEDNHNNFTRFLVIGHDTPKPTGRDRTSILFTFEDQPGILTRMLEPFRQRGLNLSKIESRPIKRKAWEYLFYLDIEGHIQEPAVAEAIEELRGFTQLLKHMGSYPSAR